MLRRTVHSCRTVPQDTAHLVDGDALGLEVGQPPRGACVGEGRDVRAGRAGDGHVERTNSPTGGLAEGACDVAVVRTPSDAHLPDPSRFDSAVVGLESRFCALATADPLARRRQLRLADLADRVVAVDPRTGTTTTADLWPPDRRPRTEDTHDVDDWLAVIATGRCVGVTPRPVPAAGRGLPPPPRRAARSGPARLVARRPAPRHAGRGRPPRRTLPPITHQRRSGPSEEVTVLESPANGQEVSAMQRHTDGDPGASCVAAASAPSYR